MAPAGAPAELANAAAARPALAALCFLAIARSRPTEVKMLQQVLNFSAPKAGEAGVPAQLLASLLAAAEWHGLLPRRRTCCRGRSSAVLAHVQPPVNPVQRSQSCLPVVLEVDHLPLPSADEPSRFVGSPPVERLHLPLPHAKVPSHFVGSLPAERWNEQ